MGLYCFMEMEPEALALHEKYGSHDETQMLLPLSVMYYGSVNKKYCISH